MTRFFITAGEASGDSLGAALMEGLKSLDPEVSFTGIAGPKMQRQGMESLFPMDELSVMGLAEVLPKYFHLKRRIRETAEAVVAARPDALVSIDSPDFSLRVAKLVRTMAPEIRTVHYVAPSVWAWRPGRAEKMARVIDQVLALLPFEPPYMEAAGMRCDFVGHPVVSEPQADAAEVRAFRASVGIADESPVVLVLPGSRKGEVTRLSEIFGETLSRLHAARSDARFVLPVAPGIENLVRELTATWKVEPILVETAGVEGQARKRAAFASADVAMAASGTVSLELAAAATPMVIAYDMAWLTRQILTRMIRIDTVTLVNLVSDTRAVPEFLGEACQPEPIFEALMSVLNDPGAQLDAGRITMERLGRGGEAPGLRAARAVLDGLNTRA